MPHCPECHNAGRSVQRVTLQSLLRPEQQPRIGDGPYYVCLTPECTTVYYGKNGVATFTTSDLGVRFGIKETDPPQPICYCFDHTVEEIHDEIRRTGCSTVLEQIKTAMQDSGCRCEFTNPMGGCCLKTVQAAVTDAFGSMGLDEPNTPTGAADDGDCCAGDGHGRQGEHIAAGGCAARDETHGTTAATSDCCRVRSDASGPDSRRDRAGTLAAGGSVVAAVLSSACCWLPLLLIAFGASAAGVAGFFEAYRPHFIIGSVGLLGFGFYMVYFHKQRCAPDSACATPNSKLVRFNKVMLWTATALVGAFMFFPNYVGYLLATPPAVQTVRADQPLATASFHIEGMTCAGCAAGLRADIAKLPNVATVDVDYPTRTARVQYVADKPDVIVAVMQSVKSAGYSARPLKQP